MKTVFFHMNQLGDLLFSLPVIKAAADSGVGISCIVRTQLAPILEIAGIEAEIIPKEESFSSILAKLRGNSVDRAILFSESPKSLCAAFLSGIKERIGFQSASLSFLLTKKAQRRGVPSLFNNRNLGISAGLKNIKADYTDIIKIPQAYFDNVNLWLKERGIDSARIIAISCGASAKREQKTLSKTLWAEIIDALFERGFIPVLSGASFEREMMSGISHLCRRRPEIFSAEKGILDSAAFLKTAPLFLGIDSGAMHLAAAVGTKCIGIFTSTDPLQIGPMPLEKHIIVEKEKNSISAADILNLPVFCAK
ncbi:MAG: glycosyltransferase family 9 protein [Elusimicrobiota bacterium]|nr:glycosyltransferase family 9 protein [Elusimicrobiota bacterium]